MSTHVPPTRSSVQLGCWLRVGADELLVTITNISTSGLAVRLLLPSSMAPLTQGQTVGFRLIRPGQPTSMEGSAVVVWTHVEAAEGRRTLVRAGLRMAETSDSEREKLDGLISSARLTLLVMDEDPELSGVYRALSDTYRVLFPANVDAALELLQTGEVGVLVSGEHVGELHCLPFLQRVSEVSAAARTRRIIVSEYTEAGQLRVLVNSGKVFRCLRKPFDESHLRQTLSRAADAYLLEGENELLANELDSANQRLTVENALLRQRFAGPTGFELLVGGSPQLQRVKDEVKRLQRADIPLHLHGETGTGKELVARAIHLGSVRADGPFVAQNCAAVSQELLQSTLFGHVRGAFTGADREHVGLLEQADGGTLFLDEVSELAPAVQASLLRAVEEGVVTPLGSLESRPTKVRIISATHSDLRAEVERGRFREDLYFRLVVSVIELPPLRERAGDIVTLARHFLDLHCEKSGKSTLRGFSPSAMAALERYRWPGNVRELSNEIERVVVLATGTHVQREELSPHIQSASTPPLTADTEEQGHFIRTDVGYTEALLELERILVKEALERAGGNISRASRLLGMERSRLTKLRSRLAGG